MSDPLLGINYRVLWSGDCRQVCVEGGHETALCQYCQRPAGSEASLTHRHMSKLERSEGYRWYLCSDGVKKLWQSLGEEKYPSMQGGVVEGVADDLLEWDALYQEEVPLRGCDPCGKHLRVRASLKNCGLQLSHLGQRHTWRDCSIWRTHAEAEENDQVAGTGRKRLWHRQLQPPAPHVTLLEELEWSVTWRKQGKLRLERGSKSVWLKLSVGKREKRQLPKGSFNCSCFLFL